MPRDVILSGISGIALGGLILLATNSVTSHVPLLVQGAIETAIVFVILFVFALVEMPVMVIGLRQLAHSAAVPRGVLLGTHAGYVAFGMVYASIFLLITQSNTWALALGSLTVVRFLTGIFVR